MMAFGSHTGPLSKGYDWHIKKSKSIFQMGGIWGTLIMRNFSSAVNYWTVNMNKNNVILH